MKILIGALIIAFLLSSCIPWNIVYVVNISNNPIEISVNYLLTDKYIPMDSIISFTDSVVNRINPNAHFRFNKKQSINNIDSASYRFTLSDSSTAILEPVNRLNSIRKIIIRYPVSQDTVNFFDFDKISNHKNQKHNYILKKNGYGKFIIYIK